MGYKVKFCENCRKAYIPTGPRQRYCDSCRPKVANMADKVADMADINALRSAVMKQAKRDGAIDRMIENGAAAQLFPGTDPEYIRRLANKEKEAEASEAVPEVVPEEAPAEIPEEPAEEAPVEAPEPEPAEEVIETKEEKKMGKNYEQIEDVWEALKEGREILVVDFGNMVVFSLNDCTIRDIREAMESEDTLFFRERSNI